MTTNKMLCCAAAFVISLLMGLPHTAQAMQMEQRYVVKVLDIMEGDWFDVSGNRVLRIHDGFINGCEVLAGYDFAGSSSFGVGRFDILESTGRRKLYLEWDIRHSDKDSIKLNDSQMLHRTAKPSFNESVAGIHLGMTSAEVSAVLGAPTQTADFRPYVNETGWYYAGLQIGITFDADTVDRILLFKGGSAVLDQLGLNCMSDPSAFAKAYHMSRIPKINYDDRYSDSGIYGIGNEEYLSFGNRMDYIMLTKYWN